MFIFYLPEFDVAAAAVAAIVVAVVVVLCCWRAPISKRRCRQRWRSCFAFDVDVDVDVVWAFPQLAVWISYKHLDTHRHSRIHIYMYIHTRNRILIHIRMCAQFVARSAEASPLSSASSINAAHYAYNDTLGYYQNINFNLCAKTKQQ